MSALDAKALAEIVVNCRNDFIPILIIDCSKNDIVDILNLLRISYPYDGEFEYAQVKNEKFVSSLEILKHEVESAPNVVLDEVYTSMKDRPEHHEDNEDHGIGVQQTAVYSVYQNTPDVIQDKPKIPKKIQKIEKKQKDIEDTNS